MILQRLFAGKPVFEKFARDLRTLRHRLTRMHEAIGRIESRQCADAGATDLAANEFQVYSQWGEDGIIQHLLRQVRVPRKVFVEFGVQDYVESNTRFLLVKDNWSGLVIDGSDEHIRFIRRDEIYWRHNLKAAHAFITRENINDLLRDHGISGEIGLLSVDIDGNDYWVWEALTAVDPVLVSVEFNWRFGPERAVSVPYDAGFVRQSAHSSWLYFGASLSALEKLGARKGYALVGIGSSAVNAFFVKREFLTPEIVPRTARELWRPGRFSEFHDDAGNMVKLSEQAQRELVLSLPLIEID